MATVWAPFQGPRIGEWQDNAYSSGWSHTVSFATLADLAEKMKDRGLQGKVTRLGIVAHGDVPGVVQLDRQLTEHTMDSFESDLQALRWYMTRDAMLIFYSCIAAKGTEGERFLNALSKQLEGRVVVGFTTYGETPGGLVGQTPGAVVMRLSALKAADRSSPLALLTPWHVTGKWSQHGQIIRRPAAERELGNRCANPRCPGHSHQTHHCVGWR